MKTLTKITRKDVKKLRVEMDEALQAVGEKYGLKLETGNISYNDCGFRAKVTASIIDEDGVDKAAKREWDLYAGQFGLKSEWFGKEFNSQGRTFTVVGIKPRARKMPVVAKNGDGSLYKFRAAALISRFGN